MDSFDPYDAWLGIPAQERPVACHRLLGLLPSERDPAVIHSAADILIRRVRGFMSGAHAEEALALVGELANARDCLLDPVAKARNNAQAVPPPETQPAPESPAVKSGPTSPLNLRCVSATLAEKLHPRAARHSQKSPSATSLRSPPRKISLALAKLLGGSLICCAASLTIATIGLKTVARLDLLEVTEKRVAAMTGANSEPVNQKQPAVIAQHDQDEGGTRPATAPANRIVRARTAWPAPDPTMPLPRR